MGKVISMYVGDGGEVAQRVQAGYVGVGGVAKRFYTSGPVYPSALNDATWEQIRAASDANIAQGIWNVGDLKAVVLNGKVGDLTFNNETYYCCILGFNHNAEKEGANRIHFGFGKVAPSDTKDMAFVDSLYGTSGSTAGFRMNLTSTNSGGWESSYMRTVICEAFKNVLPLELREVLKNVTKYTDNVGGTSNPTTNVTATTDTIFIPSEFELIGEHVSANTGEQMQQVRYQYFSNGNSIARGSHNNTGRAYYFLRSPSGGNASFFRGVSNSAVASSTTYHPPSRSQGFVPCFCV